MPAISRYVDDNRHALAQRTLGQRTFLALGLAAILLLLLAFLPFSASRIAGRWLARLLAPAPVLVFVANGFPWWRWGQPSFAALVLAGCVILALATTLVARRSGTAALLIVPTFSFAALAIDQLIGAPLQLSAPLGDSPIVAGRFAGMGNLDFAVMATSAVLVAGVLGGRLSRVPAIATAGAIALIAIIVDGAARFGNDIGGVLALVPAGIVVVALVADVAITRRRAIAVVAVTIVVAVGVALVDYARPASEQTHVGRFVGQILHGGAGTEVRRKLDSAVGSLGLTIGTFVVGVAIVAAIVMRDRLRRRLAADRGTRAGVIAAAVVAVLGAALNDSGITIAAMATIVGVAAIYGAGPVAEPDSQH